MVALPVLGAIGFSEQCANEVVLVGLALPGLVMAWYGRYRAGDINLFGFKK